MSIKGKLNSRKGFTLAETMLAVLILLLVALIMTTGIPAARNAYEKVVMGANAQVLLSTTVNSLRSELGTAKSVDVSSMGDDTQDVITYVNSGKGYLSRIYLGVDPQRADSVKNTILVQDSLKDDELGNKESTPRALVSAATSTKEMYVTYESVAYEDGVICFDGLRVLRESNDAVLATLKEDEDGNEEPLMIRTVFVGS